MNQIDIIILIIVVLSFFRGFSKGFILTLYGFAAKILSFVITYYLYPYVVKFIMNNTDWYTALSEKISGVLQSSQLLEGLSSTEEQYEAIYQLPIPEAIKNLLINNNNSEIFNLLNVSSFEDYISGVLATLVISVCAFIVVFILISIILSVAIHMIDLVSKLPFLNLTNKLAGGILGLILGVLIVYAILFVISLFAYTQTDFAVLDWINASLLGKEMYDQNLILLLLNHQFLESKYWESIQGIVN